MGFVGGFCGGRKVEDGRAGDAEFYTGASGVGSMNNKVSWDKWILEVDGFRGK